MSESDFSGKIQVNYRPNDDWLIYGGVSRGIKAGGFNLPLFPIAADDFPFDGEVLLAYEVGFKSSLTERVRLNASAFYYDYSDYQAYSFDGFATFLFNANAKNYGGEIELATSPSTVWTSWLAFPPAYGSDRRAVDDLGHGRREPQLFLPRSPSMRSCAMSGRRSAGRCRCRPTTRGRTSRTSTSSTHRSSRKTPTASATPALRTRAMRATGLRRYSSGTSRTPIPQLRVRLHGVLRLHRECAGGEAVVGARSRTSGDRCAVAALNGALP